MLAYVLSLFQCDTLLFNSQKYSVHIFNGYDLWVTVVFHNKGIHLNEKYVKHCVKAKAAD